MIAEIVYHKYDCHPETCNHTDHNSWWVLVDNKLVNRCITKRQAQLYCKERNLPFTAKNLTWDDIL